MSDNERTEQPGSAAARPTGKRQLSGSTTTSTKNYESKRVIRVEDKANDDKPSGGVSNFVPEVVSEMKKVIWPTGREMVQYTLITFAFLIVLTALVWGVDTLTGLGVEQVLTP